MSKKKKILSSIFLIGVTLVFSFVGGYFAAKQGFSVKTELSKEEVILRGAVFYLGMFAIFYFHIIVHEGGHLLFGLLTGYKFGFFRVGSLLFMKQDGRWKRKKLSVSGTGGQCLMIPPVMKEEKLPYRLYYYGGVIMNLLFSLLFLGLSFLNHHFLIKPLLVEGYVIGFLLAIFNGLPIGGGYIENDAISAGNLRNNKLAMKCFYGLLKINEGIMKGVRIKEVSEEYFISPAPEEVENGMIANMATLSIARLMDERRFDEAEERIDTYLSGEKIKMSFLRSAMIIERVYLHLIKGEKEEAEKLISPEVKKFLKRMKNHVSILRVEYSIALLKDGDRAKATSIEKRFEKIAKGHPFLGEIKLERELMELVRERAKEGVAS